MSTLRVLHFRSSSRGKGDGIVRHEWIRLAGAVIAAVLLPALLVATSTAADAKTPKVLTHFYDPGIEVVPSPITCDAGGNPIHGVATFGTQSGDNWVGTTSYDYCVYPQAQPAWYSFGGTETFTGTVQGCGQGSMTWTQKGTFHSGTQDGGGQWQLVSGTGGLAGVKGGGTSTTFVSAVLENYGYFSGKFTC
jgi:hypothetical protein